MPHDGFKCGVEANKKVGYITSAVTEKNHLQEMNMLLLLLLLLLSSSSLLLLSLIPDPFLLMRKGSRS